jgi:hypothetical protein
VLEQNLLLQGARVFGFHVGETGGYGALVSFEVVGAHFEFTQLDLCLLVLLPQLVQFPLEGRCCGIVGRLQRHELGLPFVSFRLCAGDLDLEILLGLLGPLELSFELCLELPARDLKLVEFRASFCEHVGDLIVLFPPVVGRRVTELVVVERHEPVPAQRVLRRQNSGH